ncbi:MAG: efflux RND transporter periplasmic adaptor subunit, partial [Candidatus Zixiibacteriota bacterium]
MAMNESKSTNKKWFSFIPTNGPGIVTLIVLLIMAFSLGALITGNGKDSSVDAVSGDEHRAEAVNKVTWWTCSMHPQIKLPEPGKCPICFMDLIPLKTDSGEQLGPRQLKMSDEAIKLAQIQTSPVIRGSASTEIRLAGKISYDETRLAGITAWVPGRLERLYVDYTGQRVKKGDPLVEIYSPRLISAQEEFIQSLQTFQKIGDSSSVLYSTARETLEASRNKLKLYGLNDEQITALERKGEISDTITIYSSISGVVVGLNARQGVYVETGTVLYQIADLTTVWAIFDAYESDLPWMQTGQSVSFISTAFPGEKFMGRIDFIDPVLNDMSRTVRVRASISNPKG